MKPIHFDHYETFNKKSTLTILVILGVVIISIFRFIGSENELQDKVINEVKIVTATISAPIIFEDTEEIQHIHHSLIYSEEILLSCLYDKSNRLISTAGKVSYSDNVYCGSQRTEFPLYYLYSSEIIFKNNKIGHLQVYVSRSKILLDTIIFLAGTLIVTLLIWLIHVFAIKRLNQKIQSYESQLQQLIARRDGIIENEHRKIAIEIHDQIGQLLSSANFNIRYLKNIDDQRQKLQLLADTEEILNQVYSRVKNISSELHPAVLDFGIQAAIEWLADSRLSSNHIEWSIKRNREIKNLNHQIEIVLFKICQEAFTNILKHSHASLVTIQLNSDQHQVKMSIKDNGVGIKENTVKQRFSLGLIGISERARGVGGHVMMSSNNTGTLIEVTLPYQEN